LIDNIIFQSHKYRKGVTPSLGASSPVNEKHLFPSLPFFYQSVDRALKGALNRNCYRNFPKSFTPPFLRRSSPQAKACQQNGARNPAPHPRHTVTSTRTMKHRGEPIVLSPPGAAQPSRLSYFGGGMAAAYIVPPPRRRASPPQKQIGWVCSLRFTSLRSGRKPFINGSKGEGQPPARGRGP
jgi:hypothetical protein